MRFYVEGNVAKGTVMLELVKTPDASEFKYRHLYLEVPGVLQPKRIYLEKEYERNASSQTRKKNWLGF